MTTERQEPVDANSSPSNGATPVGQVFAGIERVTRRLPAVARRTPPRPPRPPRPGPSREQITSLIEALGDSAHPLHVSAVDELAALGPAAAPAICEALAPDRPWLTVYRAAEVAGRIADGRVTGPLIQALNHPNSNVRWSAVRALTQIGDVRALLELRRVAQHDQGRTSWGESVSGAAQSALNEIGRRSVWGQSLELIKTAVTAVLMIFALILAFSTVTRLREEIDAFGLLIPGQTQIPQFELPTAAPAEGDAEATGGGEAATTTDAQSALAPTTAAQPTVEPVFAPTTNPLLASSTITGTVRQDANIRPLPGTDNTPVGRLAGGDEVRFIARTADSQWFLIGLGERRDAASTIATPDGTGWINQSLVSAPTGELPIQQLPPLAPTASP